ncbi:hypothetical protein COJ65_07805 [Bacillus cereus]|nr:hypothetical protein COJ65_07805 [Bacillus cereus]
MRVFVEEECKFRPISNVLESAIRLGRTTGIVATSKIQHATPASFSSHHASRKNPEIQSLVHFTFFYFCIYY